MIDTEDVNLNLFFNKVGFLACFSLFLVTLKVIFSQCKHSLWFLMVKIIEVVSSALSAKFQMSQTRFHFAQRENLHFFSLVYGAYSYDVCT